MCLLFTVHNALYRIIYKLRPHIEPLVQGRWSVLQLEYTVRKENLIIYEHSVMQHSVQS